MHKMLNRGAVLAGYRKLIADGKLDAAMGSGEQASINALHVAGSVPTLTGSPRFISADAQAAYLAGVLNINSVTRHKRSVAGGLTVVRGRMFSLVLYAPFASAADIPPLLDKAKADIARFIADNGG